MILAELAVDIAIVFQQFCGRGVIYPDAVRRTWHTDGQQAGPEWILTENESRTSGGAGLLRVGVREDRAFLGNSIDVRRPVSEQTPVVGADVVLTDIITKDDDDVGFFATACLSAAYPTLADMESPIISSRTVAALVTILFV
jgi:hypothetical protein